MRVQLKNVGIIDSCDIEFVPGINLILGSSGSGKSTLMRCLYNMAVNEFSDSDISFGKNKMNVNIAIDDNTVEYHRSIKAKGERFYYVVNGETYVKVGRTPLPAVQNTLKIGNVDVNGEDVNFNFNLQFSSPFLILGSQSTLYNVLTYRSTFDISSINDYYTVDIKTNASDIAANTKLKEQLESNLKSLEHQAESLMPVEKLYSDYIAYKHKCDSLHEMQSICSMVKQINQLSESIKDLSATIKHIDNATSIIEKLNDLSTHNDVHKSYNKVCKVLDLQEDLLQKYDSCSNTVQELDAIKRLSVLIKQYNTASHNVEIVNSCTSSNLLSNEDLIYDLVKQRSYVLAYNRSKTITDVLESSNNESILVIEDLIRAYDKTKALAEVCAEIKSSKRKCTLAHNKLAKFGVCPLCGNHLEIEEENEED